MVGRYLHKRATDTSPVDVLNLYGEEKYSALTSFLCKLSALCEASSAADGSASGLCGKQKYSPLCFTS